MALWGKDFIDLVGPGFIAFDGKGEAEFRFGAVEATLDCSDTPGGVDFSWAGFDEMDEASGKGWVEIQDAGGLVGEIAFHNGDESEFKAQPWSRSHSSPSTRRTESRRGRRKS